MRSAPYASTCARVSRSTPAEVQAFLEELESNPPHAALGMVQEFTVTSAESTPGPLPETEAADPTADVSPSPQG